ncbi:MAG: EamA family transporter [Thermoanaerobaculia bacterium]|nr:EamA family transporter [Thermoanaerobaculia bacterium]
MSKKQLNLLLAMATVYLVWGSTYLAIRFAVESLPPLLMAAVRFLIAGGILCAWRASRGDSLPTRRQLRNSAIVGAALLLGGNGAVVIAETWMSSGLAALLVATVPLFVVIFDFLRPGGLRPSLRTTAGLIIGFLGITLLIDPSSLGAEGTADLLGGALLLFAACSWAAGTVFAHHADLPDSDLMGASTHMLFGGSWLLIAASLKGEWSALDLNAVTTTSIYGLLYLIVFGSLVGFVAYSWLMRHADSTLVSTYAYVNPVIAVLLGWALAGEIVTGRTLVAGTIVLMAVALITSGRRPSAVAAEVAEVEPVSAVPGSLASTDCA